MILTTEHIGKTIQSYDHVNPVKLIAIEGNDIWVEYPDGSHSTEPKNGWELVLPPKKPSEIIMGLMPVDKFYGINNQMKPLDWADYFCDFRYALLKFLDEHMGEKK